jgi:hypothetical protein
MANRNSLVADDMRRSSIMRKSWLLLVGIVVSVTCLFAKVIVDYDHAVSFGKYHTYSWIGVNVQEPLWNDRVTNAIDGQLAAKGWRKIESGGDASISVVGATHTQQTLDTFYSGGFGGGWGHRGWIGGGPGFATTTVERTPVGTLHVDIFDSQSKKVIWHGDCTDSLTGNPEKNEKKLEKSVADVFKKFPPPEKG